MTFFDCIENELIRLEIMKEDDFERLYLKASDPLIWAQHPQKNRYKRDVFKAYFDGGITSKSAYLIFDKKNNQLIGCSRFYDFEPNKSRIAIGYTFFVCQVWGNYHNSETKKLMLAYAFRYVSSVVFHVAETNIRSCKAIEKLGAIKISEKLVDLGESKPVLHLEFEIRKEKYAATH